MKNLSKHAEWLSLIEISGPFLTVSMLDKAFPQGLEAMETPRRQKLRAAYEEWREAVDQEDKLLPELHREWVRLVLTEMLEYDRESLVHASDWPDKLPSVSSQEHAGRFEPDWIVRAGFDVSGAAAKPRLFIAVLPPDTDLESVQRGDGWPVSLQERMTLLCRTHGVRVGLLTDGERWMLVNAPVGSTSSQASWYARLWFQEPITLKAFQSLLGVRRCFGPAEDTLEALLTKSLEHHEEVTDTLGEQVRRAVEVLVQCLDKADEDRNRELLRDVKPAELYEAGLTVMMRLVFVLCAEERGLLLLGDSVYDRCYAVSTLRGQLAEEADRHGPEVLDRRHDAWARLLAVFRAVYGGIEHESLRMPALGGSLFAPDRFPFLEGRAKGTRWRDTTSAPLPIDNRTVLLLLNSLQILEQSGGALLLSYRALDVEQIGHVYEGLLEHTVARVPRVTLGLQGSQKAKNPNVALAELESARLDGEAALVKLVLEVTGRSESAIRNGLSKPADDTVFGRVLGVCGGDTELAERIRPFTNLIRTDAWDDPIVYRDNSFMVTLGADRRETGTHYTPKSLTESIVTTTLEPVVYVGPAEGKPREEWTLESSREILDLKVCDPAMGSGAFLVQACRYLGEKLVEAWLHEEAAGKAITVDGAALDQLGAEEPLPSQLDERLTIARRLVAERCLYGVDVNPLAVELAKLSIWLVTLAKGRPFGFLDHNLRSGDSLLGIHRLEQLTRLRMDTESGQQYQLRFFGQNIEAAINEAIELRKRLRTTTIRDIKDVEAMARLDQEARRKLESVELIADAMIGEALRCGGNSRALDSALDTLATMAGDFLSGNQKMGEQIACQTRTALAINLPQGKPIRKPFHWALEFPEAFELGGFNGIVGNPPFKGGKHLKGLFGPAYTEFIRGKHESIKGSPDLVCYFLLQSFSLLKIHGNLGMISTKSLFQGESKESSLDYLYSNNLSIELKSIHNQKWPGKANVHIGLIWMRKLSPWSKTQKADIEETDQENKLLPYRLVQNASVCFQGTNIVNGGFIVDADWAQRVIDDDQSYKDVLFPLIEGSAINSLPDMRWKRWIIDFHDWPIQRAEKYKKCFNVVEQLVFPERQKSKRERYKKLWWQYGERQQGLYDRAKDLDFVIAIAYTSNTLAFVKAPSHGVVYYNATVICSDKYSIFAVLQSNFHLTWVKEFGSTLKGDSRYAPERCFESYPFCNTSQGKLEAKGLEFMEYRADALKLLNMGITKANNLLHAPEKSNEIIQKLRDLQIEMDYAVAAAYDWNDLDLGHGFHETKQGVRFTISEEARCEVLHRLLKLNHERYEEEVKQGLHDKKKTSTTSNKKKNHPKENVTMALFNLLPSPGALRNGTEQAILNCLSATKAWLSKDDILTGSGVPASQWQSTINQLLADGLVERQGERRGARYRAVKNGGNR